MGRKNKFNTKNTDNEMKLFGVYEIYCLKNYKRYIGSTTTSFRERWGEHIRCLNNNTHVNPLIQNAWNKYGKHNFIFHILYISNDKNNVIEKEQEYIDSHSFDILFNICAFASNTEGIKQSEEQILDKSKSYVFVSPEGNIIETENMRKFCRDNNLSQNHLVNVANGKEKHHKEWLVYHKDDFEYDILIEDKLNMEKKKYKLLDPYGNIHFTTNLNQFSIQHNLDNSSLINVLKNRGGSTQHKGWKIEITPRCLINPMQFHNHNNEYPKVSTYEPREEKALKPVIYKHNINPMRIYY